MDYGGESVGESRDMKESQTLEFKKSLAEIHEILETISAFSNSHGGKIIVGIEEDKDGTLKEVVGMTVKGNEIENLTNEIKQNTDPIMFPSVEFEKIDGMEVLVIEVKESLVKPVFSKGRGFKRVGRSNLKLTVAEIREMTKESVDYSFTDLVCQGATLKDIDWDFVEQEFIPLYELVFRKKIKGESKELLGSLNCINKN